MTGYVVRGVPARNRRDGWWLDGPAPVARDGDFRAAAGRFSLRPARNGART